jgi:hypothetical protein
MDGEGSVSSERISRGVKKGCPASARPRRDPLVAKERALHTFRLHFELGLRPIEADIEFQEEVGLAQYEGNIIGLRPGKGEVVPGQRSQPWLIARLHARECEPDSRTRQQSSFAAPT